MLFETPEESISRAVPRCLPRVTNGDASANGNGQGIVVDPMATMRFEGGGDGMPRFVHLGGERERMIEE